MATKIKKSILVALMGHATTNDPNLRAWPTHDPKTGRWTADYGDGYNIGARLADAGTTLQELANAGLALQSDVHGRYSSRELPDIADRRHRYTQIHGVNINPTVTPELSPSGLRPLKVTDKSRKENVRNWYAQLQLAIGKTPDGEDVTIPELASADITVTPGSPQAAPPRSFGAPKKAKGYIKFKEVFVQVQEGLGSLANMLRHSERPEFHQETTEAFLNLVSVMPDISKVTEADFDLTQIRPGATVCIYDGAPVKKFVGFVLKSRGMPADTQFIVEEYTDNGQTLVLSPVGFEGRFLVSGKPFTVPISAAYRRPPHSDDVSVVVKANGLALYGEGDDQQEVFVVSIDGDRAVIYDTSMTEVTVLLADLSPVGLG